MPRLLHTIRSGHTVGSLMHIFECHFCNETDDVYLKVELNTASQTQTRESGTTTKRCRIIQIIIRFLFHIEKKALVSDCFSQQTVVFHMK